MTNDVNERIQRFSHALIDESMLLKPNRSVDLTSRKRACAIMTGHVIDEFVFLSLNTYLVIQSRVTCVRIFVEINKAWYRNDRFARNSTEELVNLLIDWNIRSRFAITLHWMVIGIFAEHRGKSWNYISTIYFSSFFLFFFYRNVD